MSDEVVKVEPGNDPVRLREMNQELVAHCVSLEDALRNRDVEDFADVVTDETRPFWAEQLLSNRDNAIAVLTSIRGRVPANAAPAAGATVEPRPLHNRAAARPVAPAFVVGTDKSAVNAARIRNRAHEISKAEGVPFTDAFRRAEREISER